MHHVSVVIPCYKQAHFIREAIASVLAQSHSQYEIIVVDDGSPDDVRTAVQGYPSVRYVAQANQGLAAARNRGLAQSRGEFVVFLDADDHLLPEHFTVSLRAFKEHPEAALVCGTYRLFGTASRAAEHNCRPQPDHYATLLRGNFIGPPHVAMFRHEAVTKVGGFRTGIEGCEDYDLYLRLAREYPVHCHHHTVGEYRRYQSQMSQRWELMLQSAIAVLQAQRPYVAGRPVYEEAYRRGVQRWQRNYGHPLVWQVMGALRARNWSQLVTGCRVLARCFPIGFVLPVQEKLRRVLPSSR